MDRPNTTLPQGNGFSRLGAINSGCFSCGESGHSYLTRLQRQVSLVEVLMTKNMKKNIMNFQFMINMTKRKRLICYLWKICMVFINFGVENGPAMDKDWTEQLPKKKRDVVQEVLDVKQVRS
ncbi:hypothetical protein ACH5RR_029694 [Cinchona calisaya]|uniref:Uncharacterized protein n=1 Tax=Cinchona calisaya TaxID=153742 RepID=A0ABD2YTM4_9GENT